MKNNKASLAIIPSKAVQSIAATPKVTKAEAIKAAIERARQLHEAKQAAHKAKVEDLQSRLKSAAIASLQKQFASREIPDPSVSVTGAWRDKLGTVEISINLGGGFVTLLKENKKLSEEAPGYFRADEVERSIRAKLDTSEERVSLILKDESNVRVIDALLASLK